MSHIRLCHRISPSGKRGSQFKKRYRDQTTSHSGDPVETEFWWAWLLHFSRHRCTLRHLSKSQNLKWTQSHPRRKVMAPLYFSGKRVQSYWSNKTLSPGIASQICISNWVQTSSENHVSKFMMSVFFSLHFLHKLLTTLELWRGLDARKGITGLEVGK
mgnify:CR=1 FL=1